MCLELILTMRVQDYWASLDYVTTISLFVVTITSIKDWLLSVILVGELIN